MKLNDASLMASLFGFDGPDSMSPAQVLRDEIKKLEAIEPETEGGRKMLDQKLSQLRRDLEQATEEGGFAGAAKAARRGNK